MGPPEGLIRHWIHGQVSAGVLSHMERSKNNWCPDICPLATTKSPRELPPSRKPVSIQVISTLKFRWIRNKFADFGSLIYTSHARNWWWNYQVQVARHKSHNITVTLKFHTFCTAVPFQMYSCLMYFNVSCSCGQKLTMRHIVDSCPLSRFEGGLQLHTADDHAVHWLETAAKKALAKWKWWSH